MACYHPIPARQDSPGQRPRLNACHRNKQGKDLPDILLPCGKCIGCRTDRATRWAHRCMHEASLWEHNIFLTLTYDDLHLPNNGHLQPRDLQLFIKRLRRSVSRSGSNSNGDKSASIRYFAAGEYGEQNSRPHFHMGLFNYAPSDAEAIGQDLYQSDSIRELWPQGTNAIGALTAASAAYIAQYNLKKHNNNHDENGEWRPPHFLRMSLKPAIGYTWLEKHKTDLQNGYLVNEARKHGIPRYYLTKLKENSREIYDRIRDAQLQLRTTRTKSASQEQQQDAASHERLTAREHIHTRRKQLSAQRR